MFLNVTYRNKKASYVAHDHHRQLSFHMKLNKLKYTPVDLHV